MPFDSAQHGLVKVSYTTRKAYQSRLLLTRNQEANKTVAKVFRMENGTMSVVSCGQTAKLK